MKERPLIIITDGHSTREAAVLHCVAEGVHVFQLQSHTTHCTQPLDVSVFPVFKNKWNEVFDQYCVNCPDLKNGVDRATVTRLIKGSYTRITVLIACHLVPFESAFRPNIIMFGF